MVVGMQLTCNPGRGAKGLGTRGYRGLGLGARGPGLGARGYLGSGLAGLGALGSGLGARGPGLGARGSGLAARGSGRGAQGLGFGARTRGGLGAWGLGWPHATRMQHTCNTHATHMQHSMQHSQFVLFFVGNAQAPLKFSSMKLNLLRVAACLYVLPYQK